MLVQSGGSILHEVPLMRPALRLRRAHILLHTILLLNIRVESWAFDMLKNNIFLAWTRNKVITPMRVYFFYNYFPTLVRKEQSKPEQVT